MASFAFKSRRQPDATTTTGPQGLSPELKKMTGVCSRVLAEIADYEEQIIEEDNQVKTLQANPEVDEYDIKKAQEILAETQNIIPTLIANLRGWCSKLEAQLEIADQLEDLSEADAAERTKAREVWQKCLTRL